MKKVELGQAASSPICRPDTTRKARQGAGEVVYGEGKTGVQILEAVNLLREAGQPRVLATRVSKRQMEEIERVQWEFQLDDFTYYDGARLLVSGDMPEPNGDGTIAVLAAGTSDLAVAEEAALTAEFLGNKVQRIYDVGVAGLHRLLAEQDSLQAARVLIVVAGMEGALPSVVAGLVSCPVIAVPTSVGYGASFQGLAPLLGMLNSCASGVSVVNIDNGFGAAFQASSINHLNSRGV
jgi:hypothetical protein